MAPTKSRGGTKKSRDRKAKTPQKIPKTAPKKSTKAKPGTTRKTRRKKSAKQTNPDFSHELKKTVLGITILVAVCLTAAMLFDIFIKAGQPVASKAQVDKKAPPVGGSPAPVPPRQKPLSPEPKIPSAAEPKIISKAQGLKKKEYLPGDRGMSATPAPKERPAIIYEVYDHVAPPPKKTVPPQKDDFVPQIAIIIDDIGYNKKLAMDLCNIDKNITFSILPFSPVGTQLAHSLSAKGAELMLHLPMEPIQYPKIDPGPGALLASMSPDELLTQVRKDIHAVPGTVGVNNHMGSRLTADSDKMNQIFSVLKQNNLFFVDSRTSPESKGGQSARMFQLKFSHRDVFLDNFQDVEYISGQIEKLIKQAKDHGSAIGIGHPHQATLDALERELPKIRGKVKLVPASRLVRVP
ncbi:MAG: hypothetical protein CSA25_05380 [Desulfobacter postgatei]|uniref:Divergent polysaccharide deacetylase family protein n=1 Tax=Desulfobacter postgatei TaxID=2293 RepID=A0A2G6MQV6_9BACT|nr:MAG: hypothetical protein CSA25_05380 [Desulfobacter postgatei]